MTSLYQPTRLERLQELRARLHAFSPLAPAPIGKQGLIQDLIDVCVDQELEIQRLRSHLGLDGP